VNDFLLFMSVILDFFKIEMNVYGFTFSFWQIILYSILIGIIARFFRGLIFDD